MNDYINELSCWYIEQRNYFSGPLAQDKMYHKQTELTLIRQLLQELPDPGLFFLQ